MHRLVKVIAVALSILAANTLFAQKGIRASIPEITPGDIEFEIKDMKIDEILYNDSGAFLDLDRIKGKKGSNWASVVVEYEWKLNKRAKASTHKNSIQGDNNYWLDTLTFDWKVVLASSPQGGLIREVRPYSYAIYEEYAVRMDRSVTYKNISDDDTKYAVIFIDDKTITRYLTRFNKTNVFLELKIKLNEAELGILNAHGEKYHYTSSLRTSDADTKKRKRFEPLRSYTRPSFFVSSKVKKLEGALFHRNETPWEWSKEGTLERIVTEKK